MGKSFFTILILCYVSLTWGQNMSDYKMVSYSQNGFLLPYRILYPKDYDIDKSYPLILFLHGVGERGNDNEKQLVHGSKLFLDSENRKQFPAIVVFPQCPTDDFWSNVHISTNTKGVIEFDFSKIGKPTPSMQAVLGLLDSLRKTPIVNKDKIYVGGLSMGGMGTFEIVQRRPKLFAAAFPICGGGDTKDTKKYARKVPFWIFHGAKDNVVPPELSEKMVEALKANKGEVKFSLYPEANHNSWDTAFAEPELLPWIFAQKR